jgi:signal transduction histidine kinase/DNA-binding response OmpR family regulator
VFAVTLRYEHDVVTARQQARELAKAVGFDRQEQTRIATAVSEIARNAFRYAEGGKVQFSVEGTTSPQLLCVKVTDRGRGIADLDGVLDGGYRSSTGMGLGIVGARRLVDRFEITSTPDAGTTVWLRKLFPQRAPFMTAERLAQLTIDLAKREPGSLLQEMQHQNQELLRALEELRTRQDELVRLNRELEDTNRGVVALLAELDEKADHLRRADEMKSRFLSNMTHEFRTPLNSILALSRLLLDCVDGDLTVEQAKQVAFIRKGAEDLSELVNDLLDLAKVEAGKIEVRPAEFEVAKLFGALRGMLRPLLVNESVALVFDEPRDLPCLVTDESKVSQILRNFVSNALKFTERGEVRVSAAHDPDEDTVVFSVADSGIGIAPEDHERVFEEFTQLDSPLQRRVKGTGLGLPLARRLAALLGGSIGVRSEVGHGSTFFVRIPVVYRDAEPAGEPAVPALAADPRRLPVLIVDDAPEDALIVEKFLRGSPFQPLVARTLRQARDMLAGLRPAALILDIRLRGEDAWGFLAETKSEPSTRDVPILVVTGVEDEQKALALGADAYAPKPLDRRWLIDALARLVSAESSPADGTVTSPTVTERRPVPHVLVVDDDDAFRYVLRAALAGTAHVAEATGGVEGLRRAIDTRPDAILLDLAMPDLSGFDVLEALRAESTTRTTPVVVVTSRDLTREQRGWLLERASAVLSKDSLSEISGLEELRQALVTPRAA